MRKFYCIILLVMAMSGTTFGQREPINRQGFFLGDSVIDVTITTDIKKLRTEKKVPVWQPAFITMRFSDTNTIREEIRIQPRGEFRKNQCDIASLMLNFKNPASPKLSPLKKLKLVGGCQSGSAAEEVLLKEFLVYKLYNIVTIMSFRVRLMQVTYKDSRQKMKPYTQYAFFDRGYERPCRQE